LKAGVWFRRGRLFMVSPVRGDHRRFQAETPLIALFKFAEPALSVNPEFYHFTAVVHFKVAGMTLKVSNTPAEPTK
jgi:hypothetical protein